MTKQDVKKPQQKRSKEKKQRIIEASARLFSENGYYSTNTVEIAKAAGVSTGIVYRYFQDKKDILFAVVKGYIRSLSEQLEPLLAAPINKEELPAIVAQIVDTFIASHAENSAAHNEFLALSLLEEEIQAQFNEFERTIQSRLCDLLAASGFSETHLPEKVKLSYGIIEQTGHDFIQHQSPPEEWPVLRALVIQLIVGLFTEAK